MNAKTNYADSKNNLYHDSTSHVVSLKERLDSVFDKMTKSERKDLKKLLENTEFNFLIQNPDIKTWDDLYLAKSIYSSLDNIYIDATMQRDLNLGWVLDLIAKFSGIKVLAIQVYVDEEFGKGKYIAWDGQHTAIMLYLISKFLKLDPKKINIPINEFHSSKKNEMRENFVSLNSKEGKLPLTVYDIWQQQCYGVFVDKSDNPEWINVAKKQSLLQKYKLFVTGETSLDAKNIGAITNIQEIQKISVDAVENLCKYLNKAVYEKSSGRFVEGKEVMIMAHYFDRCHAEKITVTDKYIDDLVRTNDAYFKCDFGKDSVFWDKVNVAYKDWHARMEIATKPKCSKTISYGFPFYIAQLNKAFGKMHKVPVNDKNISFIPSKHTLF